ncbi:MAG: acetate--CoA ligase family protein [Microbacterium sp.]
MSAVPGRDDSTQDLSRVLKPSSVAFVGLSPDSFFAPNALITLEGIAEVFFVHPRHTELFGRPAYPSLAELGRPVDAVFTVTSAARTVEIVRESAAIGAGGVVTIAGGFAESGSAGAALQAELTAIASAASLPVIGPNGVGMANVRRGLSLLMQAPFARRPGGLSGAFHSGSMVEAVAAAAAQPGGPGLNILVSAGNEPVTDIADYLDYLVDDDETTVIALGIESIRRPVPFFAAAARAQRAGKPIIALKTGRGERARRMAASHTGAIVGDAWVYDVALRQAGIQIAADVDDLVARAHLLERLPRERWSPARGVAVLTTTGGFAQLASDLADEEKVAIPDLPALTDFVRDNIPGSSEVTNPLDATGFAWSDPELWERIVEAYASCDDVDAIWFPSQHGDWDEAMARTMAETFARVARHHTKPFVIAPLSGTPGTWLGELAGDGLVLAGGFRATLRGLATMREAVTARRDKRVAPASSVETIARPSAPPIPVAEGRMLGFGASMELLTSIGIPVAQYALLQTPDDPAPAFDGPYVVKLADVAHRTELDAVRVGVGRDALRETIVALQQIARTNSVPATVAVQEMVDGLGEVFVGIQGGSQLGPVVAFGLGGVFVEVLDSVAGRIAPISRADAEELIDEFDRFGIVDGHRGRRPWPRAALADLLVAVGGLAAGGRDWIESIDLNPLIITDAGPVAVDALCLVRDETPVG